MARPALEVADILRDHGPAWREANRGHVSLDHLKVMSAIEELSACSGGHVARCEDAARGDTIIVNNSCRSRHCPHARLRMAADREAELPVPYFHVVYTLPSKLRDIAYQNKRVVYDLLMKAAAETTLAIAADPRRLGARIGVTAVLHTWGSTLTHHPHVHMIVPGGGLSPDGARWVACRSNFLVHVNLLARLFSGKMLAMLADAHDAGQLTFFNAHAGLADKTAFKRFIAPLRRIKWVVYCKVRRSRDRSRCCAIRPVTPTVSPSRPPPHRSRRRRRRLPLEGLSHRTGRAAGRRCGFTRTSSSAACFCTCCRRASTAFATTEPSPTPTAPRPSRPPARCSAPSCLPPIRNSSRISCPLRHACSLAHAPAAATA